MLKKLIIFVLFLIGGLQLIVGISYNYYPSLVLASCLLYAAVSWRRRQSQKSANVFRGKNTDQQRKKITSSKLKEILISVVFFSFAAVFILSALITRTFPGIAIGLFFGFYGIKKVRKEV